MNHHTAERVGACVRAGMDWHALAKELHVHWSTARTYIAIARKIIGADKVPFGLYGKNKTAPQHELVAKLWRDGLPESDISLRVGKTNAVSAARIHLGAVAVPLRPAHPRGSGPQRKANPLVTMRDLDRHLVRALGRGEYIFRNAELTEELWTKDPAGTHYKPNCRLRFVSVLGLTEKRTA